MCVSCKMGRGEKMREDVHLGYTYKTKFFIALLTGLLALGGIIVYFGLTSTAFALSVGGMGDFIVKFEELNGEGFSLHPHLEETSDDEAPVIRNKIDKATIEGLHIYKDLSLPGDNWIRINITASEPTTIRGLIQDAKIVEANLQFGDMGIEQKNTSNLTAIEAFKQNWTHQAETVKISDAEIATAYLFQSVVSLQSAQISIESIEGPGYDGIQKPGNGTGYPQPGGSGSDTIDSSTSSGGLLPKTASDYMNLIVVGFVILLVGGLTLYIKRLKFFKR